jgi:hypothetical protein
MGFIKALLAEIFTAHVPHPRTDIWAQESIPNLAESIPGLLKRLQIRALFPCNFDVSWSIAQQRTAFLAPFPA